MVPIWWCLATVRDVKTIQQKRNIKTMIRNSIMLKLVFFYIFTSIPPGYFCLSTQSGTIERYELIHFKLKISPHDASEMVTGYLIRNDMQTPPPPKSKHALKFVWDTFQNISNQKKKKIQWKFFRITLWISISRKIHMTPFL